MSQKAFKVHLVCPDCGTSVPLTESDPASGLMTCPVCSRTAPLASVPVSPYTIRQVCNHLTHDLATLPSDSDREIMQDLIQRLTWCLPVPGDLE